jgi:hypothetical protein
MIDLNGVELAVGDDVVYTNRNLNNLQKGKVFKITKGKLEIKYGDETPITYQHSNMSAPATYKPKYRHNIMYPSQVMKLG